MTKFLDFSGLTAFWNKVKEYIGTQINSAVSALKLENITDVEATNTEVNHLTGVKSNVQEQIDLLAPKASPVLTGTPTAPTAASGNNTQQIATTAFVTDAVDKGMAEVKSSLSAALTYCGTKNTYEELPASGAKVGDTYNVTQKHGNTPAGTNYAWDGSSWDPLGGDVDLSIYLTSEDAITVDEINGLFA